jgi:hypothetical protein
LQRGGELGAGPYQPWAHDVNEVNEVARFVVARFGVDEVARIGRGNRRRPCQAALPGSFVVGLDSTVVWVFRPSLPCPRAGKLALDSKRLGSRTSRDRLKGWSARRSHQWVPGRTIHDGMATPW